MPFDFNNPVILFLKSGTILCFNIETSMLNREILCFHTRNRTPAGVWSDASRTI